MSNRDTHREPDTSGEDKRRHGRFGIEDAEVEYMKVELLSFVDKQQRGRDKLVNASEGGMLFLSEEEFELGQSLSLVLVAPDLDDSPKMRGKVVRSSAHEEGTRFQTGVEFSMCGSQAAEILRALADQAEAEPGVDLLVGLEASDSDGRGRKARP